ncbi:unnamed protein product, partial [Closterium sp. Naga37s-1]
LYLPLLPERSILRNCCPQLPAETGLSQAQVLFTLLFCSHRSSSPPHLPSPHPSIASLLLSPLPTHLPNSCQVILMDHVDWLGQRDIDTLCQALRDQVKPGGRVIWRSASRNPEYAKDIEKAGFKVVQVRSITQQQYMDRVNMYASFYVAIRNGGPENIQIFNEPPNPLALTNGTDAAAPTASS